MRSRSIISIVGLFALSAMVLMVGGCSDDDPVSPPVIGANEAIDDPTLLSPPSNWSVTASV